MIAKDAPLAEITLRKYEKPHQLDERMLVKKLCLSLGLLQIGDSRDIIVDVLLVLLKKGPLSSKDVEVLVVEGRTESNLPLTGAAPSNIRRQIKRLRDMFIIEKVGVLYRINENATLPELFEERIEQFLIPSIVKRVKEYITAVEQIRHPM